MHTQHLYVTPSISNISSIRVISRTLVLVELVLVLVLLTKLGLKMSKEKVITLSKNKISVLSYQVFSGLQI